MRAMPISIIDGNGDQSFSGNTPPNVPRVRRQCRRVLSLCDRLAGRTRRHRSATSATASTSEDNPVTMDAYTVADAYVFVDIPKSVFHGRRPDPADIPRAKSDRQAIRHLGRSRSTPIRSCSARRAPTRWPLRSNGEVRAPCARSSCFIAGWAFRSVCLFAMWFSTGIVMHFVPFPGLTEAERIDGLTPIDPSQGSARSRRGRQRQRHQGRDPRPAAPAQRRTGLCRDGPHRASARFAPTIWPMPR